MHRNQSLTVSLPAWPAVLRKHGNVMYRHNLDKCTHVAIEGIFTDGISNAFME